MKGKGFYGQEPRSGEYTTTECAVNCIATEVALWGIPKLQSITASFGQWRQRRKLAAASEVRTRDLRNARPIRCLHVRPLRVYAAQAVQEKIISK